MSALARAWSAAWFGPVLDVRVWLMGKAILVMLALDAWVLMIERGGRYGAGAFNVAHFAWLSRRAFPWSAIGAALEVGVTFSTFTATRDDKLFTMMLQVFDYKSLLCIHYRGARRNQQCLVAAHSTISHRALAGGSFGRSVHAAVRECREAVNPQSCLENEAAAITAVPAIRTPTGNVFLSPHAGTPVATFSSLQFNDDTIDEHGCAFGKLSTKGRGMRACCPSADSE